ncbi:hypothetical protein N7486_004717 [Penicillium sp. IBT 16267x]|nr:hypothetical protein N7486_004717 [Penicillium sp. IBT 16267x]
MSSLQYFWLRLKNGGKRSAGPRTLEEQADVDMSQFKYTYSSRDQTYTYQRATASELLLEAQHLLHDQLYQQIQVLQAKEQELRLQLHNQALATGRPPAVLFRQPFIQFPIDENSGPISKTGLSHPPRDVPLHEYAPYYPPFSDGYMAFTPLTVPNSGPSSKTGLSQRRPKSRPAPPRPLIFGSLPPSEHDEGYSSEPISPVSLPAPDP